MAYQNHKDWIEYLTYCYENKIIPDINTSIIKKNKNNSLSLDQEINNFEEVIFRSNSIDFYQEWLGFFPPILCRQKGFACGVEIAVKT
tara:strand:+ start:80 stop:343 length:264 start_codon:yes stop_codon:yes gene_type:complete